MDSKVIYGTIAIVLVVTVLIVGLNMVMTPHEEDEDVGQTIVEYELNVGQWSSESYTVDISFDSDEKGTFHLRLGDNLVYSPSQDGPLTVYFNAGHVHKEYIYDYADGQTYEYVVNNLSLEFSENIIGKRV